MMNQGPVQSQNSSVWHHFALYPTLSLRIGYVFKGEKTQGHKEKEDYLPA